MEQTIMQCGILMAILMLAVDRLNPIKFVCDTLDVPTEYFAYPVVALLLYTIVTNASSIIYYATKIFFVSIISIFFREIDVIGRENVPRRGPIIFTGNHANQFVDALMVLCNSQHKVGFLIAAKSWNQLVVGTFARCIGCIPVERPQDNARPATGLISFDGTEVQGEGTLFLKELKDNDKISIKGEANQYRVAKIHSDTSLTIKEPYIPPAEQTTDHTQTKKPFERLVGVDQGKVFGRVFTGMKEGACIGIFPEGGSHDRTDLLPLKAGVAIIAFGTLELHNVAVPVVPIGLNYYRRNRFRGRAVVEFGPPIYVPEHLMDQYKEGDKKGAYQEFLHMVEDGMRATLVTAPDEDALRIIHMARRLWLPTGYIPSNKEKQDLNRRFAEGYRICLKRYTETRREDEHANSTMGEDKKLMLKQIENLRERILDYVKQLESLGLRDYQVPTLRLGLFKISYTLLHLVLAFVLSSIPSLLLNAPVGIFAKWIAESHRKKALAGSKVKINAVDVMLSKKITISIVMVPTLWLAYAVLLYYLTSWDMSTVIVALMCFPIFSYIGVMATEQGVVDLKDLQPALLRVFSPSDRRKLDHLPALRQELRSDLRTFIKKYGPLMGPVYNLTTAEWDVYIRKTASSADLLSLAKLPSSPDLGSVMEQEDLHQEDSALASKKHK